MTTTDLAKDYAALESLPLSKPGLPRWAPVLVAVVAAAAAALLALALGWGWVGGVIVAGLLFLAGLPLWSAAIEGRRAAVDRLMTGLIWSTFAVAVLPLISLIWIVIRKGAPMINGEFLTFSMRNIVSDGGGIYHAIIGTVLITVVAALISVPIGIFTAIYLIEYGKGKRLAKAITFLVDVMTGIPSIVAGLFALALFILIFGPQVKMGFGGSVALSLLMIPIVVRSSEEMLRLVPDDLREASYALGVSKWRTIVKVVLPTALGGIVTGITVAIARVIGETAPLLIVCGLTDSVNFNLFDGRMTTLPTYIYSQYFTPGIATTAGADPPGYDRAWGAALVLIIIVLVLNLFARIIGKIFAPKTGR